MPEKLPLEGKLQDTHIIELLHLICSQSETGCLQVEQQGVRVNLYFEKGTLRSITSNYMKNLDLSSVLLSKKIITEDEYKILKQKIENGEGKTGDILKTIKDIPPATLHSALRLQARSKLVNIFRWTAGNYNFQKGIILKSDLIITNADMYSIVLKGVENHLSSEFTRKKLEELKKKNIIKLLETPLNLHGTKLIPAENNFVYGIKNKANVKEIFKGSNLKPMRIYQLLIFLYGIGKIEFIEPAQLAVSQKDTVDAVLSTTPGVKKKESYTRNEVLQLIKEGKSLEGANLLDIDLSNSDISFAHLVGANLQNANLRFATIKNANLSNANLYNADLSYAKMEGTNFKGAILTSAKLYKAKYEEGTFTPEQLAEAVLGEPDEVAAESTKIQYIMMPQIEKNIEQKEKLKSYVAYSIGGIFLIILISVIIKYCI